MFGGALFVVSAVMISSMPRGCIGDECGTRPMRETGAAGVLLVLALLLVVVGMAELVIRARNAGCLDALGRGAARSGRPGDAPGFNDQNAQALLAIPNGLAWIAVGYVLWSCGAAHRNARAR